MQIYVALTLTLQLSLLFAAAVSSTSGENSTLKSILDSRALDGHAIIVLPINLLGLANRLRTISGIYSTLTRLRGLPHGRPFKLLVIWKSAVDCPAEFQDLFSLHLDNNVVVERYSDISVSCSNQSFERCIRSYVDTALHLTPLRRGESNKVELFPQKELLEENFLYSGEEAAANTTSPSPTVFIVWTRGGHALKSMHCKDFLFTKSIFYEGLVPLPEISSMITTVKFGNGFLSGRNIVGVHIRAFDTDYDWAVVSPSVESITPAGTHRSVRFDEASPLEAFVEIMRNIIHAQPTTLFFVASNSPLAVAALRNVFPDHVFGLDHGYLQGHYRSSLPGIKLALAEFYLLGDSSLVIHSRGSSFAREAAARRLRPTIDVRCTPCSQY